MNTFVFRNLPLGTLPSELAEFLWATVGIGVPNEQVRVVKNGGQFSTTAFVDITANSLVEFLNRNLAEQPFEGRTLRIEKVIPKKP